MQRDWEKLQIHKQYVLFIHTLHCLVLCHVHCLSTTHAHFNCCICVEADLIVLNVLYMRRIYTQTSCLPCAVGSFYDILTYMYLMTMIAAGSTLICSVLLSGSMLFVFSKCATCCWTCYPLSGLHVAWKPY